LPDDSTAISQRFFVDAKYGKTKISSHGGKNGWKKHSRVMNETRRSRKVKVRKARAMYEKADNALRKAKAELKAAKMRYEATWEVLGVPERMMFLEMGAEVTIAENELLAVMGTFKKAWEKMEVANEMVEIAIAKYEGALEVGRRNVLECEDAGITKLMVAGNVVNEAAATYKRARVVLKKQKTVMAKQQPHVTARAV
jgi:hypothetical protein